MLAGNIYWYQKTDLPMIGSSRPAIRSLKWTTVPSAFLPSLFNCFSSMSCWCGVSLSKLAKRFCRSSALLSTLLLFWISNFEALESFAAFVVFAESSLATSGIGALVAFDGALKKKKKTQQKPLLPLNFYHKSRVERKTGVSQMVVFPQT